MEMNRNQYFFVAVLLMLIGVQLRMVLSYELKPEVTRFLAARTQSETSPRGVFLNASQSLPVNLPPKVVSPPDWLGWCLISVGAVLFFHSLTMKRPGSG